MARDFDGINDDVIYGVVGEMQGTCAITVHSWARLDDHVSGDQAMVNTEGGGVIPFILFFDDSNPSGTDRFDFFVSTQCGGGNDRAATTAGVALIDTWQAVTGRWEQNTSDGIDIHVDGTRYDENASSPYCTSTQINSSNGQANNIGEASTGGRDFNGKLGESAGWDVILTTTEIQGLANGVTPFVIRHSNLQYYSPIYGNNDPEGNFSQNPTETGTVTGPTKFAGHPPVMMLQEYI